MKCTFSLPIPVNNDPDYAICTCQACGAAILLEDFRSDARKIHEAWHERVQEFYDSTKGMPIW